MAFKSRRSGWLASKCRVEFKGKPGKGTAERHLFRREMAARRHSFRGGKTVSSHEWHSHEWHWVRMSGGSDNREGAQGEGRLRERGFAGGVDRGEGARERIF